MYDRESIEAIKLIRASLEHIKYSSWWSKRIYRYVNHLTKQVDVLESLMKHD